MEKKPHIVVVGAGFGGVYAAHYLTKELGGTAEITLINRDNYFLFTPLLHEVATGSLSHQSVAESIAEIFRKTHVHFAQTEVHRIDLEKKLVEGELRTFPYDYLVVASGAQTNMYGIPGVAEHAIMLKTLSDALSLRKQVIESIKKAAQTNDVDERKKLLSFVIVGGGPTGVELAAELSEFTLQVAKSYYANALSTREISITLIASSNDLVPQFSPQVRAKALSVLKRKEIKVFLGIAVTKISTEGVETKKDKNSDETQFISAKTVVWVAGVEAVLPEMNGQAHLHKSGRLMVNEFLQVEGHMDAFALGDGAILPMKEGEMPVPQLAQAAIAEAKIMSKNISALIKGKQNRTTESVLTPFVYRSKGMLISLGSWQAAGDIFGFHPSGTLMWFVWRTIYLFKFNSWRKRFSIAAEWTVDLFSPRDISEI